VRLLQFYMPCQHKADRLYKNGENSGSTRKEKNALASQALLFTGYRSASGDPALDGLITDY
jgi:hypothetical protein